MASRMNSRFAYQVVLTMLALVLGCDGGGGYVSVGDGMDRQLPGVDPLDGATNDGEMDGAEGDGSADMDGAMDGSSLDDLELPDGSIILGDGAIQLLVFGSECRRCFTRLGIGASDVVGDRRDAGKADQSRGAREQFWKIYAGVH